MLYTKCGYSALHLSLVALAKFLSGDENASPLIPHFAYSNPLPAIKKTHATKKRKNQNNFREFH